MPATNDETVTVVYDVGEADFEAQKEVTRHNIARRKMSREKNCWTCPYFGRKTIESKTCRQCQGRK